MSVLDGCRRVLFAHAHPDDEVLATGVLIAALTASGLSCPVLTATRGELGEVLPGPWSTLVGTPGLARLREQELAAALAALGVRDHYWLGTPPARAAGLPARRYTDSGMRWVGPGVAGPAADQSPESFTSASLVSTAADLAALLAARPVDLLVSYDADGGYGHPDHVRMHEVSVQACQATATPMAVVTSRPGPDVEWLDLADQLPAASAALAAHASQLRVDGDHVLLSGGQREPIVTALGLRPWRRPSSECRHPQPNTGRPDAQDAGTSRH